VTSVMRNTDGYNVGNVKNTDMKMLD